MGIQGEEKSPMIKGLLFEMGFAFLFLGAENLHFIPFLLYTKKKKGSKTHLPAFKLYPAF